MSPNKQYMNKKMWRQVEFEEEFCNFLTEYKVLEMNNELRARLEAHCIYTSWDWWYTNDIIWYTGFFVFSYWSLEIEVTGWWWHCDVVSYKFNNLNKIFERLDNFLKTLKSVYIECREELRLKEKEQTA